MEDLICAPAVHLNFLWSMRGLVNEHDRCTKKHFSKIGYKLALSYKYKLALSHKYKLALLHKWKTSRKYQSQTSYKSWDNVLKKSCAVRKSCQKSDECEQVASTEGQKNHKRNQEPEEHLDCQDIVFWLGRTGQVFSWYFSLFPLLPHRELSHARVSLVTQP